MSPVSASLGSWWCRQGARLRCSSTFRPIRPSRAILPPRIQRLWRRSSVRSLQSEGPGAKGAIASREGAPKERSGAARAERRPLTTPHLPPALRQHPNQKQPAALPTWSSSSPTISAGATPGLPEIDLRKRPGSTASRGRGSCFGRPMRAPPTALRRGPACSPANTRPGMACTPWSTSATIQGSRRIR